MNLTYRLSTEQDIPEILNLFAERFGNRSQYGVTENINGRYLLAFDKDILIAMTGIIDGGYYNGPEIDWTCIKKEYEGHGIITKMIYEVTKDITSDIYCSCWRMGNSDKINLYCAMSKLGFIEVNKEHKKANSLYNNCKNICVIYQNGCKCYEDLYLRPASLTGRNDIVNG